METASRVQIVDHVAFISHNASLGKLCIQLFSLQLWGIGQTGPFSLCIATGRGEKIVNSNLLNFA